jgi:superfamily I DNA/RNA helicase
VKINLNNLNPNQREAVLHQNGPLLILAGAGSGKTNTMCHRIAYFIAERQIPARHILGLSFTNKAAGELKDRVRKLVRETAGSSALRGLSVTTFHSLCVRILREYAHHLGFQNNFSIIDQNDQTDIVRQILRNIRVDDRKFDAQTILFQLSRAKNEFLEGPEAEAFFNEKGGFGQVPDDYASVIASCYPKYQEQLKTLNCMDFDDLIYYAVKLLKEHKDVCMELNDRFKYILIDEYQDTNKSQFQLVSFLTTKQQNLCVVGDDDQSIYAWRGADPSHILGFSRHFPQAKTIILDQNYRSTSTILNAANQVIAKNKKRHPKNLWSDRGEGESIQQLIVEDDRAEGEMVAKEILALAYQNIHGEEKQIHPWSHFAILYRSNTQSRIFEEALRLQQIPYRLIGSMSFLDRKEIKDLLCYWRLIVNSKDDASIRRVLNWPARGIGKTSIQKLGNCAFARQISVFEALDFAKEETPRVAKSTQSFKNLILSLRKELITIDPTPKTLSEWALRSLETIGIRQAIDDECDDAIQASRRFENCEELANSIGQISLVDVLAPDSPFKEKGEELSGLTILREFLSRLILQAKDENEKNQDVPKDEVTLMTLHSAKGLEFPIVFLAGMEEGLLPHKRVLEELTDLSEERRLCYVGVTRAMNQLYLTRAKTRIRYGKAVPRTPSRFLDDFPADLLVNRDESSTPDISSKEAKDQHENKVRGFLASIRARLEG